MNNSIEKVQEIMKDMDFVNALLELDAPEDVQAAFEKKGVNLSIAEIEQIGKAISESCDGDEISEDMLDNVSGGIALETVIVIVNGDALAVKNGTVIKKEFG